MSTPASRARTRKSPDQRSDEIHAAAVALAREQGLAAVTLRAVAARAGVASGLVAHYTDGMDELVARTFARLVGTELDEVRDHVERTRDAGERLATLFETVLGREHDDITRVWVDAWSQGRSNPALAAAIDTHMARWQQFIAQLVDAGRAEGRFRTEEPDAVAWQLLAMIDGLSAHALARGTDAADFVLRLAQAGEVLVGADTGAVSGHLRLGR